MHTVQLLLKTSKYERHEIDRRFHALAHLHNVCVKHARKCMIRLQHDKRYAELRQLYNELVKKEKMSKEEKSQKKKLAKQLAACRTEQGLSKASLERNFQNFFLLSRYRQKQIVYGAVSRDVCLETEKSFILRN